MKFSVKVQYGLQAMIELASNYGSGQVQIADIAKEQKVPIRYLEQLLLILKREGLIASTRGKEGGYTLIKHPGDVTILEIVETLDGPIQLADKKMKKIPFIFEAFERVQGKMREDLAGISLEDLVTRQRQKEKVLVYSI
ncbi:MAG: Rrf2 family transcriptional regulator [Candidatus Saganbacteria bacterium]|nr:Rrf2 family transcriptional regulator [Candidatus Saganbacteria bacterium]